MAEGWGDSVKWHNHKGLRAPQKPGKKLSRVAQAHKPSTGKVEQEDS